MAISTALSRALEQALTALTLTLVELEIAATMADTASPALAAALEAHYAALQETFGRLELVQQAAAMAAGAAIGDRGAQGQPTKREGTRRTSGNHRPVAAADKGRASE